MQSQKGVLKHCAQKINGLTAELSDAQANVEHARANKWNQKPFKALVRRIERKVEYFKKIGQAVTNGYLIVPDVWGAETFAVRVSNDRAVRWRYGGAVAQKLPAGEGVYVDDTPICQYESYEDDKGNEKQRIIKRTADLEIDWPVTAVHPSVIEATNLAMKDRIFDTIKIARNGDPFILGEIADPSSSYKVLTFFIAWFLDTKTI